MIRKELEFIAAKINSYFFNVAEMLYLEEDTSARNPDESGTKQLTTPQEKPTTMEEFDIHVDGQRLAGASIKNMPQGQVSTPTLQRKDIIPL
jgi:hypothetical protein